MNEYINRPSPAFSIASWLALAIGIIAFFIGLWNASMPLNEKGYYVTVVLFGLFSAVTLQKTVRDRLEGIYVTDIYYLLCWIAVVVSSLLLLFGLWNASLALSEKGFYIMAFCLSLFGAVTTQKNIRDLEAIRKHTMDQKRLEEQD